MSLICRICGNSEYNTKYVVREMMFGFKDEFDYFQCSKCECLQVTTLPKNLDKYYPTNYYSFSVPTILKQNTLRSFLNSQRTKYSLTGKGIIGRIISMQFGDPLPDWIKNAGLTLDSKILDVGCGAGHLLLFLQNEGFSDLTGFDPYIQEDHYYDNGVRILKRDLKGPSEAFDFVMLHHSFEHVAEPLATLNELREKLSSHGRVLIRIPIVSSFAWKHYRINWVQLDAPRHLYLHSLQSMELLAKRSGFSIDSISYDSSELQFWGSEQYIRNIPLRDKKSYANGLDASIFSQDDISRFRMKAKELNMAKEGDQACFLMRKR